MLATGGRRKKEGESEKLPAQCLKKLFWKSQSETSVYTLGQNWVTWTPYFYQTSLGSKAVFPFCTLVEEVGWKGSKMGSKGASLEYLPY